MLRGQKRGKGIAEAERQKKENIKALQFFRCLNSNIGGACRDVFTASSLRNLRHAYYTTISITTAANTKNKRQGGLYILYIYSVAEAEHKQLSMR